MNPKHDLSTLNTAALAALPLLGDLRRGYNLQRSPGNGCAGDAPGFPTYFTRNVYTPNGNNPQRGPTMVVDSPEGPRVLMTAEDAWRKGDTWDTVHARSQARMRELYAPLPFDHPRVQAWIAATHQHLHSCYVDDAAVAEPFEYGKPATIIFPVPSYKLRAFTDDPRFSDEWRTKERAAVDQQNADKRAAYAAVATLDNHRAVRSIREIYPEYAPTAESIAAIEAGPRPGDWWHRHAECFSPTECPGLPFESPGDWGHRSAGWCQMCGAVDGVLP